MNSKSEHTSIPDNNEISKLLYDFNNTSFFFSENETVVSKYEEQARNTPNQIAITYHNSTITYGELRDRVDRAASSLASVHEFNDEIIGIYMERSIDLFVAILTILKLGGAYLPIDITLPEKRIRYMLDDCSVKIIVTDENMQYRCKELGVYNLTSINFQALNVSQDSISEVEDKSKQNSVAYVIYTSGSTGKPKGVIVSHRNLVNFIYGIVDRIGFVSGENILCITSISFDIFALESLMAISIGMTVVLASDKECGDLDCLVQLQQRDCINVMQLTPTRLGLLLHYQGGIILKNTSINKIIIGGEPLNINTLEKLKQLTKARIYNAYGPTETTIWSSVAELTNEKIIHIGKPIANTQFMIFDASIQLVPIGDVGELCISGDGVSKGYVKKKDVTKEKFVPNPFLEDRIMYKTGDLAKWDSEGNVIFVGRKDDQIKIRGYRIELGEIENNILGYIGVKAAAVVAGGMNEESNWLIAFYSSECEISHDNLRIYLSNLLPEYMIPDHFVRIDEIPFLTTGKINKNALIDCADNIINKSKEDNSKGNDTEKIVLEIWKKVLNCEKVGVDDNFFNIGGNSLKLMRLHSEIEKYFPGQMGIVDMFSNFTVRKIAKFIEGY